MSTRRLLVVATRGSATKGKIPDDEYCSQWGLPDDARFAWCCTDETNGIALLVLHGHRKARLEEAVVAAADLKTMGRPEDLLKDVGYFYYHSVDPKVTQKVEMLIRKQFKVRTIHTFRYQSGGGLAIEELIRTIRNQELASCEEMTQAIEQTAAGRSVFVARLRGFQSALICLRLLFDVGRGKDLDKYVREAAGVLKASAEGSKGKFKQWLNEIKNTGAKGEKAAVGLIEYLGGALKPDGIQAEGVWQDLSSTVSMLSNARENPAGVTSDIQLFSRAVDILLDAADRLPYTLKTGKTKQALKEPKS